MTRARVIAAAMEGDPRLRLLTSPRISRSRSRGRFGGGARCDHPLSEGELIGQVVDLSNFGAGDILEIQPPQGETVLLPFTKAVVPIVDVAGGRVVVEPPAEVEEGPGD